MPKDNRLCIFCYAYRLNNGVDGGFTVNVYGDDQLSFTTVNSLRQKTGEQIFVLPGGTARRILDHIRGADTWLAGFPIRMRCRPQPEQISIVGLDSYPLFQLEDIDQLLCCPFLSKRGHNARLMYNLLEDISAELGKCGFSLSLYSFFWNSADPLVKPVESFQPVEEKKTWAQRLFG